MSGGKGGALPESGLLVAVVGPSGVGKDSVINGARMALGGDPRFVFPVRRITRASDETEAHESMSVQDFCLARDAGSFALSWQAHGLHYGLPANIADDVAAGKVVAANLSRGVVAEARNLFGHCAVVLVTATPEILAARLAARGRETTEMQASRLLRPAPVTAEFVADHVIANNGALALAVDDFTACLNRLAATGPTGSGP
jgi:ribose 1,5-bisphosphokinase